MVDAVHEGIRYEIVDAGEGWRWSFTPPVGARRSGRVGGGQEWAVTVARRAIEVWHLMNPHEKAA